MRAWNRCSVRSTPGRSVRTRPMRAAGVVSLSQALVAAAAQRLGVAADQCLMIGDIGSDVDAALTAGARAVLVLDATRRSLR